MTQASTPTIAGYETPKPPSLGQRTGRGLVWMVGQTLITKVASVVGQIVLAWYLTRGDMGVAGLAYAVAAIPAILRDAGLVQILVHRHAHFRRWAGPGFWMSLTLGGASAMLLVVIAPIAARVYHAPQLSGLVLLLAATTVFNALATVPAATVQANLWYRFQSILGLATALSMTLLTILMARWRFGAYSIILPYAITNAGRAVVLWIAAPARISMNFHLRRWRYLIGDSGILLATSVVGILIAQGDYMTMGLFASKETVGIFYFAFGLSMQTLTLLTVNLGAILFPALNKLRGDRNRQVDAFLRAARVFGAIAIPLCLMQAAVSDPGMRLIFKAEWYPAIPVLQLLSVAMVFRSLQMPAMSLAAAQNHIRFNLILTAASSVVFLCTVAIGAWLGKSNAPKVVACAELIFFAISDPFYIYSLLRLNGRKLKDVVGLFAAPCAAGGVGAIAANLVTHLIHGDPTLRATNILKISVASFFMIIFYFPLLLLIAPKDFNELCQRIRAIV